ncbi:MULTISPECIES: DUF4097 family beta strand repeat-containing protein [unclassified Nocardiopsis]|uniref:DUF4097 family beta strand repeat-containing protein n=1 Tax=Nocardiopsis TaxID=2013 RepID=UPI00387B5F01
MTVRSTAAATAALLLATTACAAGQDPEPEQESFAPASDLLTIDADNGNLRVSPGDVEAVEVTRWISSSSLLGDPEASWELLGDTLELRVRCGAFTNCEVEYEIVVPEGTTLTVLGDNGDITAFGFAEPLTATTDNGRVSVADISGPLTLTSENGDLIGQGISSAEVAATTDNGRVELELTAVPDAVTVHTDNGDAEITLPDAAYAVAASSDNGEVVTEVTTDADSAHRVEAVSDNGRIRLLTAAV